MGTVHGILKNVAEEHITMRTHSLLLRHNEYWVIINIELPNNYFTEGEYYDGKRLCECTCSTSRVALEPFPCRIDRRRTEASRNAATPGPADRADRQAGVPC